MVKVRESTIIDAPVDDVWRLLRDFNGHDSWHPAVVESRIEQGRAADEVGAVRRFRLADGRELQERLLSLSDEDRAFTYGIVESPVPLLDYVATVRLKPVTDGGRTFWEWSSSFVTPPGREGELAALVANDIYRAGFEAIRARLSGATGAPATVVRVARRAAGDDDPAEEAVEPPPQAPAAPIAAADTGPGRTQAVVVSRHGGPDVLEWREVDLPAPQAGEVRIRHTAIGVNYIDVYCRTGYFDLVPPGGVPGMEAAGVVEAVGAGVRGIGPGDRVAYACAPPGAYAVRRVMKADLLVTLPDDMDDAIAAAMLLKGATAEFLLHRVHRVREQDVVLVQAAAGGVGQFLCQWASALGATVIGTVGSPEKERVARRNGCSHVIRYREEDVAACVMDITGGHGADVVFDGVGRATFMKSFEALAVRGHIVSFGQASGDIGPVDIPGFAAKSATVSRPNYGHYMGTTQQVQSVTQNLFAAWRRGIVRPDAIQHIPLKDAAAAHRALESRSTTGSVVLVP